MLFGAVLDGLKTGKKYTCLDWNGKHAIALQVPDAHSANTLPYIYIVTEKGARVPWVASQSDMLSNNWEVV